MPDLSVSPPTAKAAASLAYARARSEGADKETARRASIEAKQAFRGVDRGVVAEWVIRICPVCGKRTAPHCPEHPDDGWVQIRVVPKDIERFREEVGDD